MSATLAGSSTPPGNGVVTASTINSYRIGFLVERLTLIFRSGSRSETANGEIFDICIHMAKGIDYAVTHNEVPPTARDLPSLIKQNACRNGWFQATDIDELLTLTDEISNSFCESTTTAVEPSNALQIISKIISRFYPQMKMGHIIISFEAKPGYEVLVSDFLINKNMAAANAQERIRLFVAQTDNIETSSCLITPPEVNFMLNGKGVERRTNVLVDGGPQLPTDVTTMLKYGANLIQVIGKFIGNYIIIIAYASVVSSFNAGSLQDYVQPAVEERSSDAEIIEGPSRISLNCPISYKRINTPVKGHLCRHHQCFDYNNFLEINSRKPSWRCPHCNQSVCFTDLRVDQHMVRVLKEVGEDVADVLVSADGSWTVIDEHDLTSKLHNGSITFQQDVLEQAESKRSENAPANVVDLTMELTDDDVTINSGGERVLMDFTKQRNIGNTTCETEDRKPFEDIQMYSGLGNLPEAPGFNSTEIFQEAAGQTEQSVWSRISSFTSALNVSVAQSTVAAPTTTRADALVGISDSSPIDAMLAPVLTDAVSPALNREPVDVRGATQVTTGLHNATPLRQFVAPENLQLQHSGFENSIVSNENLRRSIPRHVCRTPIAIQALPAQKQVPNTHQQRPRPNVMASTIIANGASAVASQMPPFITATSDGFGATTSEIERQQLSMSQINPVSASDFTSSRLHAVSQLPSLHARDLQSSQNQLLSQVVAPPATSQVGSRVPLDRQHLNPYRSSSGPLLLDRQMPHTQCPPHLRVSRTISQPENLVQQSASYAPLHSQQPAVIGLAVGSSSSLFTRPVVPQHSSPQMMRPPGVASQLQASRTTTSSLPMNASGIRQSLGEQRWNPVSDSLTELPSEETWRLITGRMRGSLTGRSYSAALSQFMAETTSSAQSRPPITGPTPVGPAQLQVLLANSANAHGQSQVYPGTGDVSRPGA
ncbi:hypothetical protein AAC387_Pa10g0137 [Persea americana]